VPGVFKRGRGYIVRYRDRRGIEHKRSARTFAEARDLKATLTADIKRGEHRELKATRLADYADEWAESYSGRTTRGLRESTRESNRLGVRTASAYFHDSLLAEIEPGDVRAYVRWLQARQRTLAPATVRKRLGVLKLIFACAVEDGLLRTSPAVYTRVTGPATEPKRARTLTREQLAAVLQAVDPGWTLFFELLAVTGLRIGEALELRWRDLDLWKRRLHVRRQVDKAGAVSTPKTWTSVRQVPLSPVMCRRLSRLQRGPDELLWTSPRGQRVDRTWLRRYVLDPAAEKAGVPWLSFHGFRHTCASLLFDEGRSAVQVQRWLGHSDPAFTLRSYIHLIDDDALGEALDERAWRDGAADGAARATSNEATAKGGESAA
jgi:integrase